MPYNNRSEQIKEKNYFFLKRHELPFIDLSRLDTGKRYYGKLFLTITALQDIFIGSGEIEMTGGSLYDAFSYVKRDPQKKTLNIPGSSLKGTVSANLALFLKSSSTDFMGSKDGASKVYFADFPMTAGGGLSPKTIPGRFGPKDQAVPGDAELKLYLKDDPAYGNLSADELRQLQATERILTVKKGSGFSGFINFKLLTEYELTLLVLALGILPDHGFNFKIGGAKNRGLGLVKTKINKEKSFCSESLKTAVRDRGIPYTSLEGKLSANMEKLKQDNPKLEKVLQRMNKEYDQ